MVKSKSHMPPGFHTVTPYIVVPGIARLIDFSSKLSAHNDAKP